MSFVSKIAFPDVSLCASTDELRPRMNYILYDKGCFVATDGHILVRIPFEIEPDSGLPEVFAIHRKHFKPLTKSGTAQNPVEIYFDDKYLIRFHKDEITHIVPVKIDCEYPNYEKILEESKKEAETPISEIGFFPSTLSRAMKIAEAILGRNYAIRMKLYAQNRAVRITCDYTKGFEMIVMPATLNS
jgi:DNA polymerase III sliding clamp (beta) subunit (PCNA family)